MAAKKQTVITKDSDRDQAKQRSRMPFEAVVKRLNDVGAKISNHLVNHGVYTSGLCGDFKFVAEGVPASLSAALLNAAAAESKVVTFAVLAQNKFSQKHDWLNGVHLDLTPVVTAVDQDIGVPVVNDPASDHGGWLVALTVDTDAGATKTWADGDELGVDVKITAAGLLFGMYPVATLEVRIPVVA